MFVPFPYVRSSAAFVGVEGYQANSSIGELNQNDIKPSAYEEYLFVRLIALLMRSRKINAVDSNRRPGACTGS